MFFLNLTAGEFFALLGALGGLISLLYLLDRSKRRKLVSTLRFWTPAKSAAGQQSRKKVQDPWSFLLQLAALLFLLLAIAQLQWGRRDRQGRDHILLLDASAWSAQQQAESQSPVLDEEKRLARQYLRRLPKRDRVLVTRVSGIASPVTAFTNNEAQLLQAVDETEADFSALNLDQAFEFAHQAQANDAQSGTAGRVSDVVYVGPGMSAEESPAAKQPERLRVIAVAARRDDVGLSRVEVRRDVRASGWQATITARNYGPTEQAVRVESQFGGSRFAPRLLRLAAGREAETTLAFTTSGAGKFKVRLAPGDSLPMDDVAEISLPDAAALSVAVFTDRPELLRPLLDADHRLNARFYPAASYVRRPNADVMLIDGFDPSQAPLLPSLWINPPPERSPLPVRASVDDALVTVWHDESGVSNGLHARETRISHASVFEDFAGDVPVASVTSGDVVLARAGRVGHPALAAIGFDPLAGQLRFEVTTPLLVSHLLNWLAPKSRRETEFAAMPLGPATVTLDAKEDTAGLRVLDERGVSVPFTLHGRSLNLFAGKPSIVRVIAKDRERVVSLTLPAIAAYAWAPKDVVKGLPPAAGLTSGATDLWKYLAVAGALCLLAEWWFFGRRRRTAWRQIMIALKIGGLAAIFIALWQPHLTMPGRRTAAVLLVDTSQSITPQDLDRASELVSEISKKRHTNWLRIVPFSNHARELGRDEIAHGVHLVTASSGGANTTNFEAAISDSLSAMPAGFIPRIVLMSDGNDNEGSTARAIAGLQQLHVPVDTIPLTGRSTGGLRLTAVSMPKTAYAGEQIPIDLHLEAPSAMQASVTLSAGGKELGTSNISLQAGGNDVRVHARVKTVGATAITGEVNNLSFEQAVTLSRAKLLLVSGDSAESDGNLTKALAEAGFDVTRMSSAAALNDFRGQLLVLNNLDLNQFAENQKRQIAEYVRSGGGLLLIGGEHQVYKEDKKLDALDEALPAKLAPPKTPEGTCVALIIDKSSSMEGRKIELARLSAIGVVEHLRPIDTIGVLIFDNSYQWAVPMRKAEDKAMIKRLIVGIVPDGGTQIAPALTEAYRKVQASSATYKHVVLMTDGISEEGDSLELARQAADHQVTISTVGLGQDVNRAYLEKVADVSGGKSYFLNEPQGLEQILLKDVEDYSGSTAVEKSLVPIVDSKAEVLEGVDLESAPALRGYTRFISKPDAETILSIDPQKKDPLYVRWQFGLGRAAVFTSDAKSRWAQQWVNWPGYDKFWINVSRDLLPHVRTTDADATLDSANGDLVVTYRLSPEVKEPGQIPPIFALGPDGFQKTVTLAKISERVYLAHVHIGEMTGLFRVRPLQDSDAFPETGFYRQNQELHDYGTNEAVLKQISAMTGGRFNPAPEDVFDSGGRTIYSDWQLWPLLLGLAIALTIAELVMRKWNGLVAGLKMRF
jgi:Ca-activated chloride channel family protein